MKKPRAWTWSSTTSAATTCKTGSQPEGHLRWPYVSMDRNPAVLQALSASDLDCEAALFEFCLDGRALVTLDFYMIRLQGAAHTALLLQGAGEFLHLRLWQRQTLDQGDSLAATPLGFPVQAHDPVTHGGRAILAANTAGHRALALGAQATRGGRVNQVAVFVPAHDRVVSFGQVGSILSGLANANSEAVDRK